MDIFHKSKKSMDTLERIDRLTVTRALPQYFNSLRSRFREIKDPYLLHFIILIPCSKLYADYGQICQAICIHERRLLYSQNSVLGVTDRPVARVQISLVLIDI